MRTFKVYRPSPPPEYVETGAALPPDEVQMEGVEFGDGTVVVRWQTLAHSTAIFPTWEMFEQIHGHPEYGTRIEFSELEARNAKLEAVAEAAKDYRVAVWEWAHRRINDDQKVAFGKNLDAALDALDD